MLFHCKKSALIVVFFCIFAVQGCNQGKTQKSPPPPAENTDDTEQKEKENKETKAVSGEQGASRDPVTGDPADTVLKIIHQRKSVRKYVDKPVSKEQLEKLVRAGMAAPTARNRQPWAFIVITERKTLDKLGKNLPYAKMILQTPAAIVAAGDMKLAIEGKGKNFWVQDVSAAVQNILLAAEAMGLGAVWTGVYPREAQQKILNETLSLPEHIIPLALIPVGVPEGVEEPKNKWDPKKVHWEKWGQNKKADEK